MRHHSIEVVGHSCVCEADGPQPPCCIQYRVIDISSPLTVGGVLTLVYREKHGVEYRESAFFAKISFAWMTNFTLGSFIMTVRMNATFVKGEPP